MIQIAIMGLGTVGTGVAKVVAENARQIERKLGEPLQVKTILVRHFKDGPYRQLMTDDFTKIEEDHAIRVVVETIGGVEAAYEYTKRALNAGKHVVTANKQLVAEKGAELLALAKKRGVNYLFEASVGGGYPSAASPDPVHGCQPDRRGVRHPKRHHQLYPYPDGPGRHHLCRRPERGAGEGLCGGRPHRRRGGRRRRAEDLYPGGSGLRLSGGPGGCAHGGDQPAVSPGREDRPAGGLPRQAAGPAVRLPGGRTAYVAPHLIPEEQPLASVDDVFNAVVVRGNATGEVMFYGQGAGELPRPPPAWRT